MSRKIPTKKRRIGILDDHPMTRDGIVLWIAGEPDLEVCWEVASAEEGLTAALNNPPDLIVADISLRGKSGLEFIKDLRAVLPSVPVLILSMHEESIYAERALRAGARGYIMKHEGGAKLLVAIRSVLDGKIQVSEKMAGRILEAYSSPGDQIGVAGLSDREFEIFELLGAGLSTPKIGKRLSLSPKTVDSHRANIKSKLHLTKMSELVAYAARWITNEASMSE
ncbi:MAG: response regulator transcription factor [Terrimicrobiaceae bacterium]